MDRLDAELENRRQIARRIDQTLGAHPDVTSVFVFGSVAYGYVDEWSDVDIGIVCRPDVLAASERKDLLSSVSKDWTIDLTSGGDPSNAIWEGYDKGVVDKIGAEVHYLTVSKVSRVLDQVVEEGAISTDDVPFRPYRLGSMIQRAWLLRDKQGVFAGWRDQMWAYPSQLKRNILDHDIPVLEDSVDELTRSAKRDLGPGAVNFFLFHGIHALESILFAINETYDPASRWDERAALPALTKVPEDFLARYTDVKQGPFDSSGALKRAQDFADLASEVVAIASTVD